MPSRLRPLAVALATALLAAPSLPALPVIDPATLGLTEQTTLAPHVLLSIEQLSACIVEEQGQLALDLARAPRLLDGRALDAQRVSGSVCVGPWPFEAGESGFSYRRFRLDAPVREGRAVLPLKGLFNAVTNSEGWTEGGSVLVRVQLREAREGADADLATADIPLRFHREEGRFSRLPALLEGPMVCRVDSRAAGSALIVLKTDLPAAAAVEVEGHGVTQATGEGLEKEAALSGLPTGRGLRYRVLLDGAPATEWLSLRLPGPGAEPVRFAYFGDTREQDGGGDRAYLGVNLQAMERLTGLAHTRGADFLLFGGDLISGYTIWPEDWRAQIQAWKQCAAGYWRERPVLVDMGNHETLLRIYKGNGIDWLGLDRWPYDSLSAETAFAAAFRNPPGAPATADPELPTYEGSVFSARLGCVTVIVFNNAWWYSEHESLVGGCPQGYLLDDQLRWIEKEIAAAAADPACRYIVYSAHEPVFPMAGHVKDSMWHGGNNGVRAWRADGKGGLRPLGPGIIEVRNRLLRMIADCPKSAAVLAGHEHVYARMLLTPQTPAGDPATDDPDGDGRLCEPGEPCSPLPGLDRSLCFLTNGGGSPYYAQEPSPWGDWWARQPDPARGFFLSSQEAILLFEATELGLSLTALNSFGEELERIDNLLNP
jgi:hypothetical protein